MPRRASTGKRARFEVFKRDDFTCRYCGAQPPAVVLVVDHITPVAKDGTNDIANLVTACEPCNQGKADKLLTVRQVRPDTDLLYLETQQEIAELRRYEAVAAQLYDVRAGFADRMTDIWCELSEREEHPAAHVIEDLLVKHGAEVTEAAVRSVAPKIRTGYLKHWGVDRYLRGTARRPNGVLPACKS